MRHFIVETTFAVPFEQLGTLLAAYRDFIKMGHDRRWLLCSGPQVPRTGNIIIARAPSLEALQHYLAEDPLNQRGIARYRFIEFYPTLRQACIEAWVTREPYLPDLAVSTSIKNCDKRS